MYYFMKCANQSLFHGRTYLQKFNLLIPVNTKILNHGITVAKKTLNMNCPPIA
jgi:hypothetical protein